jgi:hypothetical protein
VLLAPAVRSHSYSARKLIDGLAADVNTSLNDPSGRSILPNGKFPETVLPRRSQFFERQRRPLCNNF